MIRVLKRLKEEVRSKTQRRRNACAEQMSLQ